MRRYGAWAGVPKGYRENPMNCVAEVPEGGRSCLFRQCSKPRRHGPGGLYCYIHANALARGKHLDVPEDKPEPAAKAKP